MGAIVGANCVRPWLGLRYNDGVARSSQRNHGGANEYIAHFMTTGGYEVRPCEKITIQNPDEGGDAKCKSADTPTEVAFDA